MDIGTLTGQLEIEDNLSSVLNAASSTVRKFADGFDSLASGIMVGGAAIVGTFTAITGAIIALGNRGSDVNDVAASFERFSGSATAAGDTLLKMQEGVLGTVSNFDLMKNASKLLAADVKLTSDQFGTLTQAAFVLQNEGLGSTKEMLDLVSQALLTGRTRSLEMKIGKIDLKKAEEDYARSLGVGRQQLTEIGKTEARRTAILDALNKKVRDAGAQQRDFGEMMEFAITSIKNWGDELASQVAKSSNVINAVKAIGDALSNAFGGSGQAALERIVGWINRFADLVARYAPIVINWVANIIDRIRNIYETVLAYWDTVPDWFKKIAKEATVAAGVLYLSGKAIGSVSEATSDAVSVGASYATMVSGTRDTVLSMIELQTHLAAGFWNTTRGITAQIGKFGLFRTIGIYLAPAVTSVTSLTSAIGGLGAAIGVWFLTPMGLVLAGIPLLVGGLRLLTGSWEFLLVPLRPVWEGLKLVWQGMQDVYTIVTNLGPVLNDLWQNFLDLNPAVRALGDAFVYTANIITGYVKGKIKSDLAELQYIMETAKTSFSTFGPGTIVGPALRGIGTALDFLHRKAEAIRALQTKVAGFQSGLTELPGQTLTIPTLPSAPSRPSGRGSDELIKNDFADRVQSLAKSWQQATQSAKIFTAAFGSLSAAQRENYEIQKLLAPEINKMIAAQQKVTPAMLAVRDAELQTRMERIESQKVWLEGNNLTQGQISRMQELGMSLEDIAGQYGVATDALSAYTAQLQQSEQRRLANASFEAELLSQRERDARRKEQIEISSNKAIADSERDLNDYIRKQTLTTTEYEIDQIQRAATEQIAQFSASGASAEAIKSYSDLVLSLSEKRTRSLMVDEDVLRSHSRRTLQDIADRARRTYLTMANDPVNYSKATVREFKRIADEAQRAADGTKSAWQTAYEALGNIGTILDNIPGKFSEIAAVAARAGQAIMDNLATGDWVGALVSGATAVINIFGKLFGAAREGRKEIEKFADSFDTIKPGTGFDELHDKLLELGPAGEQMWVKLTQGVPAGNKEAAERAIGEVRAALEALDSDIQKYSLTWTDLANAQSGSNKAAKDLLDSYKRLTGAGYDQDKVLKAMSGDLNAYITNAIKAGTKIPQAMQPIIEQFIRMGGLTKDAANALLGLADDGVPSLDEIRQAAERYGLSLDQLGPKVKQLQITETADQIVKDFQTLTAAGVPFDVLINTIPESARKAQKALDDLLAKGYDKEPVGSSHWQEYKEALDAVGEATKGMGQQIQTLVTDTLKYGLELPSSLKPIIEQMIDMGALVDENGDKLMDTSRLNWATPIEEMFETLITKLDEFIDKLLSLNGIVVKPKVEPDVRQPEGFTYHPDDIVLTPEVVEPSYYAEGTDDARGKVINFAPRGTDVIPAMLTPGETVGPVDKEPSKVVIELDRRWLADILVPEIPGAVKRVGIR